MTESTLRNLRSELGRFGITPETFQKEKAAHLGLSPTALVRYLYGLAVERAGADYQTVGMIHYSVARFQNSLGADSFEKLRASARAKLVTLRERKVEESRAIEEAGGRPALAAVNAKV